MQSGTLRMAVDWGVLGAVCPSTGVVQWLRGIFGGGFTNSATLMQWMASARLLSELAVAD